MIRTPIFPLSGIHGAPFLEGGDPNGVGRCGPHCNLFDCLGLRPSQRYASGQGQRSRAELCAAVGNISQLRHDFHFRAEGIVVIMRIIIIIIYFLLKVKNNTLY